MIYIFHGDNIKDSRQQLLSAIPQSPTQNLLHLDSKNLDPNQINNFIFGPSLFGDQKILWIDNLFSAPKPIFTQLTNQLTQADFNVYLWQDKNLTPTQLKNFPQAKVSTFKPDNAIFKCLYSIKPKNTKTCLNYYQKVIQQEYYDLFLYLLKNHLRKNLNTHTTPFYLKLINLDFQNKSGQLPLPREIALEQILVQLTS